MRTLDEVITVMNHVEFCCTNCKLQFDCDEVECFLEDALHYLKMYRSDQIQWEADREDWRDKWETYIEARERHLDAVKELKRNDPLSWEQLKQMVGKPVWVEYNFQIGDKEFRDKSKRWCIIGEFKPWHDTEIIITENGFVLSKNEQIKCWQAYRKERS